MVLAASHRAPSEFPHVEGWKLAVDFRFRGKQEQVSIGRRRETCSVNRSQAYKKGHVGIACCAGVSRVGTRTRSFLPLPPDLMARRPRETDEVRFSPAIGEGDREGLRNLFLPAAAQQGGNEFAAQTHQKISPPRHTKGGRTTVLPPLVRPTRTDCFALCTKQEQVSIERSQETRGVNRSQA